MRGRGEHPVDVVAAARALGGSARRSARLDVWLRLAVVDRPRRARAEPDPRGWRRGGGHTAEPPVHAATVGIHCLLGLRCGVGARDGQRFGAIRHLPCSGRLRRARCVRALPAAERLRHGLALPSRYPRLRRLHHRLPQDLGGVVDLPRQADLRPERRPEHRRPRHVLLLLGLCRLRRADPRHGERPDLRRRRPVQQRLHGCVDAGRGRGLGLSCGLHSDQGLSHGRPDTRRVHRRRPRNVFVLPCARLPHIAPRAPRARRRRVRGGVLDVGDVQRHRCDDRGGGRLLPRGVGFHDGLLPNNTHLDVLHVGRQSWRVRGRVA
mmetsp:Transcript_27953/g.80202  ORF Transcript_27953/g.80202 Transcript_27953/m.80202 type:complete len:322 (+) Transcript_27953:1110-2075(+)